MAFKGKLFPFQQEAMDAVLQNRYVLVAFGVGVGKTILTIATVEQLLEDEEVREGLVIVPNSLKYQWESQIREWATDPLVLVIDGPAAKRAKQYKSARDYEYVILSYHNVVDDWDYVRFLGRDFVVCDEVTAVKSPTAKRTRRVRKLVGDYHIALTGTPVDNKAEELFAIMEWVDPAVLGSSEKFDRTFIVRNHWGAVEKYKNLDLLHDVWKSSGQMVRRTRHDPDVRDQFPTVTESVVPVVMSRKHAALYRKIADELRAELAMVKNFSVWDVTSHYSGESDGDNAARGRIMARILALRMLCDHPRLLSMSADKFDEVGPQGSAYAAQLRDEGDLDDLGDRSAKIDALRQHAEEALSDPQSKMVVFSFFKGMLAIAAEALEHLGRAEFFTGDMSAREREDAKKRFQTDPDIRILFSSDAGGVGVDLPQANYLTNLDLPWSSGAFEQRNARIIRLLSKWDSVSVTSLVVRGSIEERQYKMLQEKAAVSKAFLDGEHDSGELVVTLPPLAEFLESQDV